MAAVRRLKEFRKCSMLCKFVAGIFHTPLLRDMMLSKQHHHESYCSYKHHTVLIIMKNIGHMFCLLGISEFSVNALSSCSSCCSTAAVQRPEMQDKLLSTSHNILLVFVEYNNIVVSYSTSMGTRKPTGCPRVSLSDS